MNGWNGSANARHLCGHALDLLCRVTRVGQLGLTRLELEVHLDARIVLLHILDRLQLARGGDRALRFGSNTAANQTRTHTQHTDKNMRPRTGRI